MSKPAQPAMTESEEAADYRRRERAWQDADGYRLLDKPYETAGSAAVFYRQWDRLLPEIRRAPAGILIEVGCGKGHFLRHLRDRLDAGPRQLVGIDISRAVYSLPPTGLAGVQADGEILPFRDACASCIVYDGALHHLIDYRGALRDAVRVLAPGGVLVIFEPVSSRFTQLAHRLLDPLVFKKVVYESPIDIRYKRDFDHGALGKILRDFGLRWREERSDFAAYPFTGCYASSPFARSARFMRMMMRLEDAIDRLPLLGSLARAFAWRLTIVAHKPNRA